MAARNNYLRRRTSLMAPRRAANESDAANPKANLQHVEQSFNGAFSAALLKGLVDTV